MGQYDQYYNEFNKTREFIYDRTTEIVTELKKLQYIELLKLRKEYGPGNKEYKDITYTLNELKIEGCCPIKEDISFTKKQEVEMTTTEHIVYDPMMPTSIEDIINPMRMVIENDNDKRKNNGSIQ